MKPERPVVIELGAGTAIPTVRRVGESRGWPMIRINPTEAEVDSANSVSVPLEALAALEFLEKAMGMSAQR